MTSAFRQAAKAVEQTLKCPTCGEDNQPNAPIRVELDAHAWTAACRSCGRYGPAGDFQAKGVPDVR